MVVGVGVDWVTIDRLECELQRADGDPSLGLFSPAELASAGSGRLRSRRLAALFAAKEAVVKALALDGSLGLPFRLIEISGCDAGPRTVQLHGALAELARRRGVARLTVDLSSTRRTAAAVATCEADLS